MADLNIPNLKKKSDKYLFKKKLTLRRKSKTRLFSESLLMFSSGSFLLYLNYLIPNKSELFSGFLGNLTKMFILLKEFITYFLDFLSIMFMVFSLIFSVILFVGSLYRIFKIYKRKTTQFSYKNSK